jgi:hypothetical protein
MDKNLITSKRMIHARIAIPLLVIPLIIYVITWYWEPYAYGYSVLLLGSVQLFWAIAGVFLIIVDVNYRSKPLSIIIIVALACSAVGSFILLKSINWA